MWSDKYLLHYLKKTMLKLSSPLRSDQGKDDNKENILAGQDIRKPKSEGKSLDTQADKKTANQSECQEINGIDVNPYSKPEGISSATTLIPSSDTDLNCSSSEDSVITENSNSVILDSESLVENNATVSCEVNNFGFNEPEQNYTLSHCEQKTSTHSLYDDCIDVIGKNTEQENDENSLKKVSDPLNSTYAIEDQFESLEEIKDLPSVQEPPLTHIDSNSFKTTYDLNSTQVIDEGIDVTIIKDGRSSDVLNCEEKLQIENTHKHSGIVSDQSERCDQIFIEHSQNTEPEINEKTFSTKSASLHAKSPEKSTPCTEKEIFTELIEREVLNESIEEKISRNSLLNITKTNCSVEDLEKSTAKLVSDSSNRSLDTSVISTRLSESISNEYSLNSQTDTGEVNVLVEQQTDSETNISTEQIESSEKLVIDVPDLTNQVVNKSFPALTASTSEPEVVDSLEKSSTELNCTSSKLSESSSSSAVGENTKCCYSELEDVPTRLDVETVEKREITKEIEETPNIPQKKMEEINEKLQQDFSDMKLELNAAQQAKAILELEISKKDEIILKTEAEAMKKEQHYMQEIKALKEQLKEKVNSINEKDTKDSLKDLEEAFKEAKAKEVDVMKVLEEYEKTIATRFADYKKLKEENATVNRHLSNLELSFSDLHQKYEKAKSVICGYKKNEDKLRKSLSMYEETFLKQEGRYESLKAHAQTQIDKCNIEISQQKDKYDGEITKLKAIVKRLEIKNAALETSLEQKTKECIALAALCDEVTGEKF
ncbi:transforming acidic coiled-coil-containing protein 2-like isoform X2 [Coccinella septempunctata]|uniref:transforming acidic coiled-coil-containing protein 2-like isoform X2 n=1 Tax=Coccinella septempunctata TaxID=41139 RepID=UPI001D084A96|nr:transforming acidic coiled-coil-containing protein 2-like isoform X2 [Coccinella septempunctata]